MVCMLLFFSFMVTAPTVIYTLSLHDALPISCEHEWEAVRGQRRSRWEAHGGRAVSHRLVITLSLCADRKSTRLNSSHLGISYAVFCLKKKKKENNPTIASIYTSICESPSTLV